MIEKDYLGLSFIGQDKTRNEINFAIQIYKSTGVFPSCLLSAPRGGGKTTLARLIGKSLTDDLSQPRNFIEINGGSLTETKLDSFISSIIVPYVDDKYSTVFIDECHLVSNTILNWLLSALAPNREQLNTVTHKDNSIIFDFKKSSIIFASTNPEKLPIALVNRLTVFELEQHEDEHLIQILYLNSPDITYKDGVEKDIVAVCRQCPRTLIKIIQNKIIPYTAIKHKTIFDKTDWDILRTTLSINSLGLMNQEIEVLKLLKQRGGMTLTAIAASLALDVSTVRKSIESYLLKQNLLTIDGKRFITSKGSKILEELNS